MFTFSIETWRAWAPGMSTVPDWQDWARHPYCPIGTEDAPAIPHIPPLLRRRLGRLARAAVYCAWPIADDERPMPVVFASRHGQTPLSLALLTDLACGTPVSPAAFSLSVHNAVVGLWSMARQDTQESVALSASGDGLEHAMVEACLLLDEGAASVLVIVAEERAPAAYDAWIDDVPFSYAAAFRVIAGDEWTIDLASADTPCVVMPAAESGRESERKATVHGDGPLWPHTLATLRHLVLQTSDWHHVSGARCWRWWRT